MDDFQSATYMQLLRFLRLLDLEEQLTDSKFSLDHFLRWAENKSVYNEYHGCPSTESTISYWENTLSRQLKEQNG